MEQSINASSTNLANSSVRVMRRQDYSNEPMKRNDTSSFCRSPTKKEMEGTTSTCITSHVLNTSLDIKGGRSVVNKKKGNDKQLVKVKEYACMIVINYLFFYKNLTTDNIYERMMKMINMDNAKTTNYLIQVLFFIEESPPSLPSDLMNALEDTIWLQRKLEKPKFFKNR